MEGLTRVEAPLYSMPPSSSRRSTESFEISGHAAALKCFPQAEGLSPADKGIRRWQNLQQTWPHWWKVFGGMPLMGTLGLQLLLCLLSASCPPGGEQLCPTLPRVSP